MFEINDKQINKFEKDLKTFAGRAFPFATKATLNRGAFTAQKIARKDVSIKMIERNKFTKQSIQVNQSRTLNVRQQSATVGSIADYMEDQEFGAIKRKSGKEGVSIPTAYAAGMEGAQQRTKLPRRPNALKNIRLAKRGGRGASRKQRNLIVIREAASGANKYIFLDLGRRKGIFKVVGGKRRPKIKMVHDMTEQTIRIPRNPWLKPAVDRTQILMPGFYEEALRFQLKRQGLFNG